jgi:hypothetical protein
MSPRLAFAWEVAQLSPSADGLTFRVRRVGDTLHAPHAYRLPPTAYCARTVRSRRPSSCCWPRSSEDSSWR